MAELAHRMIIGCQRIAYCAPCWWRLKHLCLLAFVSTAREPTFHSVLSRRAAAVVMRIAFGRSLAHRLAVTRCHRRTARASPHSSLGRTNSASVGTRLCSLSPAAVVTQAHHHRVCHPQSSSPSLGVNPSTNSQRSLLEGEVHIHWVDPGQVSSLINRGSNIAASFLMIVQWLEFRSSCD